MESAEGAAGSARMLAGIVQGGGRGGLDVLVLEALQDVEVLVGRDVERDVRHDRAPFCGGALVPAIDGVEGEGWVGLRYSNKAFAVVAVDDDPSILCVGAKVDSVGKALGP